MSGMQERREEEAKFAADFQGLLFELRAMEEKIADLRDIAMSIGAMPEFAALESAGGDIYAAAETIAQGIEQPTQPTTAAAPEGWSSVDTSTEDTPPAAELKIVVCVDGGNVTDIYTSFHPDRSRIAGRTVRSLLGIDERRTPEQTTEPTTPRSRN